MTKIINKLSFIALTAIVCISCSNNASDRNTSVDTLAPVVIEGEAETSGAVSYNVTNNPQFKIVDNLLISDNLPVVIDFNATWCGPCKQYAPIYEKVAEKYMGQVCFVSIDVDQYPEIANAYKVKNIPCTVFINTGGGVVGDKVGVIPEDQLSTYIDQLIATTDGSEMVI